MIKRQIVFEKLTLSKRLEFSEYVMNNLSSTSVLEGGNHNKLFLKFNTEDDANAFMMIFYDRMKKVKELFAEFDKQGNLHLRYKTRMDSYSKILT